MTNQNTRRGLTQYGLPKGFTLIELLAVVLIIGILAAVALPQYQKAVERSKAAKGFALIKAIAQAVEVYYLEHGQYPTQLNQLNVDIPLTGDVFLVNYAGDAKSNADWSIQLEHTFAYVTSYAGRISGKYQGAGFAIGFDNPTHTAKKTLVCMERTQQFV